MRALLPSCRTRLICSACSGWQVPDLRSKLLVPASRGSDLGTTKASTKREEDATLRQHAQLDATVSVRAA